MSKRNILGDLMEGVAAMKRQREGKLTLRSFKVEPAPLPKVDSKLIRDTRKRLHCSRAVFARKLRINERTLEKWEQGRARPNPQAAALVLLVRKYPDTLERFGTSCGWVERAVPPIEKKGQLHHHSWMTTKPGARSCLGRHQIARASLSIRPIELNHLTHRIPPLDNRSRASKHNSLLFFGGPAHAAQTLLGTSSRFASVSESSILRPMKS